VTLSTDSKHTAHARWHSAQLGTIARGSGFAFVGLLGGAILQYLYNVVLAHIYGAHYTGIFAFSLSIISIAAIVGQLGTKEALLCYVSIYHSSHQYRLLKGIMLYGFGLGIIGSIFSSVIVFNMAEFIGLWAKKPEISGTLKILSVAIPLLALINLIASSLQAVKRLDKSSVIREIGRPAAIMFALFLIIFRRESFHKFLFLYTIILGILVIIGFNLLRTEFGDLQEVKKAEFHILEWFRFSIPVLFLDIFRTTSGWLDVLILGFLAISTDIGVYFAALRTAFLITLPLGAFNAIFSPIVADLWRKRDLPNLEHSFMTTTRWTAIITLLLGGITIILRDDLMSIFGFEFVSGGAILLIILFGRMVNGLTGGVGRLLIMTGHPQVELFNTILSSALLAIAMLWLVPNYGILGAAVANSAVVTLMNILKLLEVWYIIGIQPYRKSYYKPFVAFIVSLVAGGIFCQITDGQPVAIKLLLIPIVVTTLYFTVLFILKLEEDDKVLLQKLIRARAI